MENGNEQGLFFGVLRKYHFKVYIMHSYEHLAWQKSVQDDPESSFKHL